MANLTLIQAVNDGLRTVMNADDSVVVFGEDVGPKGGVFLATEGLTADFGESRCFDTPLSEDGIIGTAVGMAMNGLRPVAEIQFQDFIFPAFDQIVSEAAKLRYRSGGQYTAPMVIRTPYGGGIRGGLYHSQSGEAYFAHTAGLKVVIPSTPHDAKGLLLASIQDPDPVLFMEPKALYRSVKGEVPEGDYTVDLSTLRTVREGRDVTVYCYGAMVPVVEKAAAQAKEQRGIDCLVVDLRTLLPSTRRASSRPPSRPAAWSSSTRPRASAATAPRSAPSSPSTASSTWRRPSSASPASTPLSPTPSSTTTFPTTVGCSTRSRPFTTSDHLRLIRPTTARTSSTTPQ